MDLELTEAQRGARDTARRFAREKLERPGSKRTGRIAIPPRRWRNWASSGCSASSSLRNTAARASIMSAYALVVEELAVECASTAVIVSAHSSLGIVADSRAGNEAQKDHFLPKMATGEWIGCFALTEPQAGSDAAGQKTGRCATATITSSTAPRISLPMAPQSRGCDRFRDDRCRQGQPRHQRLHCRNLDAGMGGHARSKTRWGFTVRIARSSASPI